MPFETLKAPPRSLRKSFTLIELLIVIAILGVLAAAVLVAINPLKRMSQARDAQRKQDIAQIATALQTYFAVNGTYPIWVNNGDNPPDGSGDVSSHPSWQGTTQPPNPNTLAYYLVPGEIKKLPVDPKNTCVWAAIDCHIYVYSGLDNGNCFDFYANLEDNSDTQRSGPYHGNLDYRFTCTGLMQ